MKTRLSVLFGLVLLALSQSALASLITFDFAETNGYTSGAIAFSSDDGLYTAMARPEAQYGRPYIASHHFYGIYVTTCSRRSCRDNHQIDGAGPNETVIIDIGFEVELVSAAFSYTTSEDDFSLTVDGLLALDDVNPGISIPNAPDFATYDFAPGIFGTEFGFLADYKDDDFKLKAITVRIVEVTEATTMFLLGLGLLGLGIATTRRQYKL